MEEVYRSSRRACVQLGLALEAAGIAYAIEEEFGEGRILVPAPFAAQARAEIQDYIQENRASPIPSASFSRLGNGWPGVFGYVAALVVVTILQHQNTFARDWFDAGKMNAGAVRQGEWWRAITALSLHSDLVHLLANILIGGLIGLFAGQLLGSGFAWISILFAGTAGNLLNGLIRETFHTSIGASTAVFAALGIVAALGWIRHRQTRASRLARNAPLVGAVVLLSYLGTGGERTDVLAHLTGFLSGLLFGAAYGKLGNRMVFGRTAQLLFGLSAIASLSLAWLVALLRLEPR